VTPRRSSILVRVVGALVLALAAATGVTAVVATRLTGSALDAQARSAARSHLGVLQEAYSDRERALLVNTRNLAEQLVTRGLLDPQKRPDLVAELGRSAGNLELDILRVLDPGGRDLSPPIGVGDTLAAPSATPDAVVSLDAASRLMPTTNGRFVQVVPVALGSGPDRLVLIGGYEFWDPFAYKLRKQIGSVDDIVLVADGRIAGSTLPIRPTTPPAAGAGGEVRTRPTVADVDGHRSMVAYSAVSRSADDPVGGALGVVLTNPTATLQRSLAQTRLVSALLSGLVALGLGWLLFRALIRPLVELAGTAVQVAGGDEDASFRVGGGDDEIARLAGSLEHMRVELQSRLGTIAAQADELRESSQRIVAAQDGERGRLARDLHDGLQQQLVVLRMQVGMLAETDGAGDIERLGQRLDEVIEQLREVTQDLYPSILLDRGLAAALHSYVGRLPLSVRLSCWPDAFPRLPPAVESAAYFLLGEAVTNALKHSGASVVAVDLVMADGWLRVSVADDGRGFDTGADHRRGGLLHMEDRVRSFGGSLDVASAPGQGTRVVATFPVPAPVAPVEAPAV
jgi:signal transduction histidine kinase